jgi:hypothetical protein
LSEFFTLSATAKASGLTDSRNRLISGQLL